jgi:hypothetical protein
MTNATNILIKNKENLLKEMKMNLKQKEAKLNSTLVNKKSSLTAMPIVKTPIQTVLDKKENFLNNNNNINISQIKPNNNLGSAKKINPLSISEHIRTRQSLNTSKDPESRRVGLEEALNSFESEKLKFREVIKNFILIIRCR